MIMPANDPIDPMKEKLVRDLAGQAGLVLSNVRLTEDLRARLDDLRAAQKRLVTAQDQERRKLGETSTTARSNSWSRSP